MNGFEKDTLVLELVTLGEHVQRVVNVLVNLLGITHLSKETTKDAGAAHPENLFGQTGVGGTTTLTNTYGTNNTRGKKKECSHSDK